MPKRSPDRQPKRQAKLDEPIDINTPSEPLLRSSQARLAGVLDIADDAIISVDQQQRITLFNQGAEKIFGYLASEVLGQPLDMLLPARFIRTHHHYLSEFAKSSETARRMGERQDIYGLRKDGTEFPAEASISRLELEEETVYTVILRDITARKRADQSLRESQARLAGILDIADDAIISVDQQQRIRLFNQGAEKIFGYLASEVLGQPLDILLPARFRDIHQRHLLAFATSPDPARRMGERQDIYGLRKDGTEFPAEASISRLELAGETTYTVILRDITARKRVEATLREQNLELERASQAKDRFLASMSHELRTPLNAVIGFTGTLLMRLPGPLTPDQDRQLTIIQSSAKHLLALINDLLDLAKIESGRVELRLEPVDGQQLIDEVAANLRPLAEQKGLRFEVRQPDQPLVFRTDRRALSQIIINLVNNAIKFTERGDIRLSLEARAREQAVSEEPLAASLQPSTSPVALLISVSDTGIGMRPEEQAHLFEAYMQGRSASTRPHEGTGLGLHLSQKLAGLLGGVIEFVSEYGQGSTFTLVIPKK
jgi:PAS domain S-box-containing protein